MSHELPIITLTLLSPPLKVRPFFLTLELPSYFLAPVVPIDKSPFVFIRYYANVNFNNT